MSWFVSYHSYSKIGQKMVSDDKSSSCRFLIVTVCYYTKDDVVKLNLIINTQLLISLGENNITPTLNANIGLNLC